MEESNLSAWFFEDARIRWAGPWVGGGGGKEGAPVLTLGESVGLACRRRTGDDPLGGWQTRSGDKVVAALTGVS